MQRGQLRPGAAGGEASAPRPALRAPFPLALAKSHDLRLVWLHSRALPAGAAVGLLRRLGPSRALLGGCVGVGFHPPGNGGPEGLWVCWSAHPLGHCLSPFSSLFQLDAIRSLSFRLKCTHFQYISMFSPFPTFNCSSNPF